MTFSCEVVCPLMRCHLYLKKLISLDQDGNNMITWFALHISFNEEILSLQFHSEAAETFTRSSLTVQFSSCYFRKLFVCYLNIILLHNKLEKKNPNPNMFDRLVAMLNFSPTDCWVFCSALLGTGDVWELEHLLWGSHQPPDTSLVQFTSSPNLQGFTVQRLKGPLWIWGCHTGASLVDESD